RAAGADYLPPGVSPTRRAATLAHADLLRAVRAADRRRARARRPRRAYRSGIGLALAQADPVALRQAIERAAVDPEELGRELLVPARLAQHAADVAGHDAAQAQRRAGRIGRGHRPHALRREILGADDRAGRHGDPAPDGVP